MFGTCIIQILFLLFLKMAAAINVNQENSFLAISKSNSQFTSNLYEVLRRNEGNIFISPISASIVLAMVHAGAKGITADEIANGMGLGSDINSIHNGFYSLISSLNKVQNVTLKMANRLFLHKDFEFREDYKTLTHEQFLANVTNLDFAKHPEECRKKINGWVEQNTNNKIQELFVQGTIDEFSRLVLVNALYFKGNWTHQFSAKDTRPEPFIVNLNTSKTVQMMHIKKKFKYADIEELDAQVLEMPYVGGEISMIIFLPHEEEGLSALEDKLRDKDLQSVYSQMFSREVEVSFPKFKLEQTINLKALLQQIGMQTMFTDKADFSGMTDQKPGVKVSEAVQKTFIEVNEEGSEAAAATGIVMMALSMPPPPVSFVANHPFLFYLQSGNNLTLFMGRYQVPSA